MSKQTKEVVRQRVEEVLSLRLLGADFPQIRQYASEEKQWNVSDRQLWRYIAAGDKILAETLEQDRPKLVNRHIAQRRALYSRAVSVSDYGTALRVLRDEAEMLNLYPPKKIEATGKDGGPVILHIREELVGRTPHADLADVVEEVVTHDHGDAGGPDAADGPATPGPASLPAE